MQNVKYNCNLKRIWGKMANPSGLVHCKFIKFSDNLTPVSENFFEALI